MILVRATWVVCCLSLVLPMAASVAEILPGEPPPEPVSETRGASSGQRSQLEDLRLLAIAPEQERAVARTSDGEWILLAPGDRLWGGRVEVLAVLPGRIVVEERVVDRDRARIVRAWIEKTVGARTRVRRIEPSPVDTGSSAAIAEVEP